MTTKGGDDDENITTLAQIHKLEDRYPFNEEEMEILVRCHEHLKDEADTDDFIMKLAVSSPYAYFFLPNDEMRDRVSWIEDHILPAGFANELRAAISADAFVEYANQGEDKSLERFLEGVADTGRRGSKEALHVIFNLVGDDEANPVDLVDTVLRLAVASEALITPNLDQTTTLALLREMEPGVFALAHALKRDCGVDKPVTRQLFTRWAENHAPMLSAPLGTFIHNLLFHGHPFPRVPFVAPKLDHASDIFAGTSSPLLLTLAMTTQHFGGKWHRLYSADMDGQSFNRLELSLLGYSGPTVLIVKTTSNSIVGGFANTEWKESSGEFIGSSESFVFELTPKVRLYHAVPDGAENFMYLHSEHHHSPLQPETSGTPHGIGFGGTKEKPRLFIPESLEHCSADFLDTTYESGELVPETSLEKFEIKHLEIWGVGGGEVIQKALRDRAEYRERHEDAITRARVVQDRASFADDMKSGLNPNKLFDHREQARGRQEFQADEEHGGYKLDRD